MKASSELEDKVNDTVPKETPVPVNRWPLGYPAYTGLPTYSGLPAWNGLLPSTRLAPSTYGGYPYGGLRGYPSGYPGYYAPPTTTEEAPTKEE